MCLAYPGTVKEINGLSVVVEYPSSTKKVLLGDKKVKIGDKVLVQMGVITQVISEEDSKNILESWGNIS